MPINKEDLIEDESFASTGSTGIDKSLLEPVDANINWEKIPLHKAAALGVKNLPKSVAGEVRGALEALSHPKETSKGLFSLSKGLVKTGILRYMADQLGYDYNEFDAATKDQNIAAAEAIESHYLNRYGTEAGFKEALANDPASVISDILGVVAPMAKSAGLKKVISYADPVAATVKIASQPLKLIPPSWPEHLYKQAVKFSASVPIKMQSKVSRIATSAANQIMPTHRGVTKLREKINTLNDAVNNVVNEASSKGKKTPWSRLFKGLEDVRDEIMLTSDEPLKVKAAFNSTMKQWREGLLKEPLRTPEQIQKLKQRIYKELASHYEKVKASPAKVAIRKHIAKNARELVEELVPELSDIKKFKLKGMSIKEINRLEGDLIDLWDAIGSKANQITYKDISGVGLMAKTGGGGTAGFLMAGESGAKIGTGIGFLYGILSSPQVKSKMALILGRMREKGIEIRPSLAAANMGLYKLDEFGNIIQEDTDKVGE